MSTSEMKMQIRVGELEFGVKSATLHYTRIPNGTMQLYLVVRGEDLPGHPGPQLTLDPAPVPGRALGDLSGRVMNIPSPTKPDRDDPRAVNVVAGIYVYSHEGVHASRVEWLAVDERGVAFRWNGVVEDADRYDGKAPRQALVVEAHAVPIERPHEPVMWMTTRANEDETHWFGVLQSAVVADLAAALAARRWFEGMPFCAVEIVVQVDAKNRRWPELPARAPADPQLIFARLPRAVAVAKDTGAVRLAIEAEIAAGLDRLERFRQATPSFLR